MITKRTYLAYLPFVYTLLGCAKCRKHEDDDFSLVLTRYIEEDGGEPTLVLVIKIKTAIDVIVFLVLVIQRYLFDITIAVMSM